MKTKLSFTGILAATAMLAVVNVSCSEDAGGGGISPVNDNVAATDKLGDFIHAAELHSFGLECYFEEVMLKDATFTRSLKEGKIEQNVDTEVTRIVEGLVGGDSRLVELVRKYDIREATATRTIEQSEVFDAFLEESFSVFKGILDKDQLEAKIRQQLETEKYKQFAREEQDHIMFVFAIYYDSIIYWDENIEKWLDIIDPTPQTRWPTSPQERAMYRDAAMSDLGKADAGGVAKGAGIGLLGGLGISFLGGWGGLGGLVMGWLTGGIDASVCYTLDQNNGFVSNNPNILDDGDFVQHAE